MRTLSGEAPRLWALTTLTILLALLFGGGTIAGLRVDALAQLTSLPLLAITGARLLRRPIPARLVWPLALAAAIIGLPLLQLVPLPPALWTHLPGRDFVVTALTEVGLPLPWWPLSLDPAATWRAFLSLLPAVAVFIAVSEMGWAGRRSLSLAFIGFALLSVLLGLAQLMQGPDSPLRFYEITNAGSSVGFFANRNHYAALLYSTVPLTAAWIVGVLHDRGRPSHFGAVVCGLVVAALLLGLGMAQSRAGVFLGLAATVLSILLVGVARPTPYRRRATYAIFAAGLFGVILITHYALFGLLDRFEASVIDDYRFSILDVALAAAQGFFPLGSGFGTFEAVYLLYDRPQALLSSYVNHAHNDWLELWIEGGLLAALVAVAFMAWLVAATRQAWRLAPDDHTHLDRALARAASITIALLLLHSFVDYPLRTTALPVYFAVCCAFLVRPPRRSYDDGGRSGRSGRHHSTRARRRRHADTVRQAPAA